MADKKAQLKYLRERLESLSRQKNVYWGHEDFKLPKPAAVIEAEARMKRDGQIVSRFEKKQRTANHSRNQKKKAEFEACRKEVFFGDPLKALRMLEKFEAKW